MKSKIILWGLSGICFAVSALHAHTAFLLIPGIFLYLYNIHHLSTMKEGFYLSWFAGTLKSAGALWWIWSLLPISWPIIPTTAGVIGILAFYWLSAAGVIGLGLTLTTRLFITLKNKTAHAILFLPILWVIGEVVGSFLFSIFTWGPGSIPNIAFSYGYIGYPLVSLKVFHNIAVIGGVYALSATAILFGVLIFYVYTYKKYTNVLVFTLTVLLILNFLPHTGKPHPQEKIAIINTNYDLAIINTEKGVEEYKKATKEAVDEALRFEPSTIILPEHSDFTSNFLSPEETLAYLTNESSTPVRLIDSRAYMKNNERKIVQALVYDTRETSIQSQEKRYLVAHGEYLPLFHALFIHFFTPKEVNSYFFSYKNYMRGNSAKLSTNILFCNESTTPLRTKLSGRSGPFFTHIISHSWFNTPTTLWHQQEQMLQTQALWSKTPIFVSANQAPHAIYYSDGIIKKGTLKTQNDFWEIYISE